MTQSPPLQPAAPTGCRYFVLADFGRLGRAWVERDVNDTDWDETVRDLARGEWRDPIAVYEADPIAGTWRDVTERAMLAARLVKEGLPIEVCR